MYYEVEGTRTRILGSLHLFPKGVVGLPPRVEHAVSWAEHVCFEHNAIEMAPLMTNSSRSLETLLPSEMFAALAAGWPDAGLPELSLMKPWAALMAFAATKLAGEPGLEPRLNYRLTEAGRPFSTIETAAEVATLLDGAPMDRIELAITEMLRSQDEASIKFNAMYEAWVANDEPAMWAVVKDGPMIEDPVLYEAVFTERNRRWAARVAEFFLPSKAKMLLVVGNLHLQGPSNLLELLRTRGLKVSPVKV